MGKERNGLIAADRQEDVFLLSGMQLSSFQTETTVGENSYSISRSGDKCNQFKVQIFIRKCGTWVTPAVLGEAPISLKGHSAKLVDKDRIMVVLIDASINEGIWFLEVDTPYIREQKKILGTEVVAWSKGVPGPCPKPVVIAGPSGVGKGTLIGKLMEEFPSMFGFSVSHTTRLPREKEKDGIHYHFAERSLMEKDIKDGKFLEFASVHGNLYGTSIEAVEAVTDAGKRCILDIDVQGSRSVRASSLEAVFIFISPPSYKELEKRLRGRGTESEEQIQKRLKNAITEIEQGKSPGLFDHILVNDNLEECYKKLKKILGLEGSIDILHHKDNCTNKNLICNLISATDHEFTLQCDDNSSCSLNVSLLQGSAPGRTRALQISTCLT